MTVKELKDLLNQFPDSWQIRISEHNQVYFTEVYEVRQVTEPKFNEQGDIIGDLGERMVELLTM